MADNSETKAGTELKMKKLFSILAIMFLALSVYTPAGAIEPDEILSDPALELRAREVSKQLRCVVCQNQSIDDSNADLARDMRLLVRDRILDGDTNQGVLDYMVSSYGDYVLLKPPFKASTVLLWTGPFIIFVLGFIAVGFYFRRRPAEKTISTINQTPLDDDERAKIERALSSTNENEGSTK